MLSKLFRKLKAGVDKPDLSQQVDTHERFRNRYGPETIITKSRHWKKIELYPEFFPKIIESKKPDNPDFLKIKEDYALRVFAVVEEFYNYTVNLSGLSKRPDLHKVLKHVLLEFITMFWDMPASKDNHHNGQWGLLLHSLRVACNNAELGESFKLYTESGINTEAMLRDKGHIILAYFFFGLFHDAHKILDYDLVYQTQYRKIDYNPHLGSILNFKLVHPNNLSEGWTSLPQNTTHHSIGYFYWLIPPVFFSSIQSADVHKLIMDKTRKVIDGSVGGDREDAIAGVREDSQQKMYRGLVEAIKQLLEEISTKDHIYKVSDEWCAVIFKGFMRNVANVSPVFSNDAAVVNYLDHQDLIASPCSTGTPKFTERYTFVVSSGPSKGKRVSKCGLSFIRAEFVDELIMQIAREQNTLPELTRIQIEKDTFSQNSLIQGLRPLLPEESFCVPASAGAETVPPKPVDEVQEGSEQEAQAVQPPAKDRIPGNVPKVKAVSPEASGAISEAEFMAASAEAPMEEEPDTPNDEPLPHQSEIHYEENKTDPNFLEEFNAEVAQSGQALSGEEEWTVPAQESQEYIAGPNELVTAHGECLDAQSFFSHIIELLNAEGINTKQNPLAIYVTAEKAGEGKLYLKLPDLCEKILGIENMLDTDEGRAAMLKTLAMLEKNHLIPPLEGSLPETMRKVTYFEVGDFLNEKPLVATSFLGVELTEMFKAKCRILPLKEYIEIREEIEEVEVEA